MKKHISIDFLSYLSREKMLLKSSPEIVSVLPYFFSINFFDLLASVFQNQKTGYPKYAFFNLFFSFNKNLAAFRSASISIS